MGKMRWVVPAVAGAMLVMSQFAAGQQRSLETVPSADMQRMQTQDQTREQEQIYGSQLMSPQERAEYREGMRSATTLEERERIRDEHHESMKTRAREQGITLPDEPPQRGMGMGAGPGRGLGPTDRMNQGRGLGTDMNSRGGMDQDRGMRPEVDPRERMNQDRGFGTGPDPRGGVNQRRGLGTGADPGGAPGSGGRGR